MHIHDGFGNIFPFWMLRPLFPGRLFTNFARTRPASNPMKAERGKTKGLYEIPQDSQSPDFICF
jgi:hypothetical protein